MKRLSRLLLTLILLAASAAHAQWSQYATPAEAGYDAEALATAYAHADSVRSAAVVVVADGRILAAWGAVDRKLELHSVRKSIYAAMWGIAEARGLARVDATLAELGIDDVPPLTAEEKKARLVDLLQARSGVYHASAYAPSDMQESMPARGSHAPGTHWFYNNWDFNVAGALLERLAGKPFAVLFDEWIARPLGMEDYSPSDVFAAREPGASRWPALTMRLSARDLARFGRLWLDRGAWNGTQIVPAAWVDRASRPASETGTPGQGYAMMWWTYEKGSIAAERYPHASAVRVVAGRGTGGQFLAVVPELDLVFVHRADTDHGRSVKGSDVWTILDRVIGARRSGPKEKARTAAVEVKPFSSTLPPFVWPAAVKLEPKQAESLTGVYEIAPGAEARVFVVEGTLYAFMPGHGEAELFAISPDEFFVRVEPSVKIRFDRDGEGRATAVRVSIRGREITARRKAAGSRQ